MLTVVDLEVIDEDKDSTDGDRIGSRPVSSDKEGVGLVTVLIG